MEESKGLEIIETKDMEVGLRKDQPWKRDPMNPINLSGRHKDLDQSQIGTEDEGQSGGSKLSDIKVDLGKIREIQIGIGRSRSEIDSSIRSETDGSIRRREINWIN